jgi:hypothetical protein
MDIVVQPNVAFTGYFTNVIFILQIPVSAVQPTITKTSLSPYFVFSADLPTLPNEAGYVTYGYASVNASVTANTTLNAGELYPILRLTFLGGTLVESSFTNTGHRHSDSLPRTDTSAASLRSPSRQASTEHRACCPDNSFFTNVSRTDRNGNQIYHPGNIGLH